MVDLTLLKRLRGLFIGWILSCFNTQFNHISWAHVGLISDDQLPGTTLASFGPLNMAVWEICSCVEIFYLNCYVLFFHQSLIKTLSIRTSNVVTSLAAIGHMLLVCPESFAKMTEQLVKDFVIGHLLLQKNTVRFIYSPLLKVSKIALCKLPDLFAFAGLHMLIVTIFSILAVFHAYKFYWVMLNMGLWRVLNIWMGTIEPPDAYRHISWIYKVNMHTLHMYLYLHIFMGKCIYIASLWTFQMCSYSAAYTYMYVCGHVWIFVCK